MASDVFEGARGRCADGNNTAAFLLGAIDSGGGVAGEREGLGVEANVFGTIDADRLESSEAYVESDVADLDAARFESRKDFGSEMQAGGGGGSRAKRQKSQSRCDLLGGLILPGYASVYSMPPRCKIGGDLLRSLTQSQRAGVPSAPLLCKWHGENRLVAFAVFLRVWLGFWPVDVGRQW
jgi:hypothetical protein